MILRGKYTYENYFDKVLFKLIINKIFIEI